MSEPIRLLLIEDNPGDARLIEEMLRQRDKEGFGMTRAERLSAGLDRLVRDRPDLIILDLGLPDCQGMETLRRVRDQAPQLAVIVLTGMEDESMALTAVREGAQDYLVKGRVDGDLLIRSVRYAMERKAAERAARSSEEKFVKAFQASPLWMAISSLHDGRGIEVNESFLKGTGFSREEVIGRTAIELGLWVDPEERRRVMDLLARERPVRNQEIRMRTKAGEIRTVLWCGDMVELAGERCLIAVMHDITDRKGLEAQLVQAQKMEGIGRLVGGIAHDFNNLITAVLGYCDLVVMDLPPGERLRADVQEIRKAGERASALVAQLLAFSRRQMLEPVVLDLAHILKDMEPLLRRIIGEDIELAVTPGSPTWPVKVDPSQMEQVIMNLAVNARDAMPLGGKLTIELANVELDEAYARSHLDIAVGPHVMLAVSDTGVGMDAATRSRVFEPFFTTKEPGKGTGLGLATVYGIVRQSGGSVWVYSELGQGTTFKIYLPAAEGELVVARRSPAFPRTLLGTETVLVVEDEEAVRALTSKALNAYGYQILTAPDGESALRICREHQGSIHVLVTDVIMPGMNGQDLAARARSMRPDIKVVFMSGYPANAVVRNGALACGKVYLQKPFTPEELAEKVREALGK